MGKKKAARTRIQKANLDSVRTPTSKAVAVGGTVAIQLHNDGRWPPNDLTKMMGGDYHYTQMTLIDFLAGVQWHLSNGKPPLSFEFDTPFVFKGLQMTVAALMAAIASKTKA